MNALERNQKAWREIGEKITRLESENARLRGIITKTIALAEPYKTTFPVKEMLAILNEVKQ